MNQPEGLDFRQSKACGHTKVWNNQSSDLSDIALVRYNRAEEDSVFIDMLTF